MMKKKQKRTAKDAKKREKTHGDTKKHQKGIMIYVNCGGLVNAAAWCA